jgi:hypothetical protein
MLGTLSTCQDYLQGLPLTDLEAVDGRNCEDDEPLTRSSQAHRRSCLCFNPNGRLIGQTLWRDPLRSALGTRKQATVN